MIWSGGMAWIADFPDPSNFYGPILGCAGAVQGGWNWSWYCNKDLDAKAAEGRRHGRPGQAGGARRSCGAASSTKIMEDAPWAPVFNEQRFTMHSAAHGRRRQPVRRPGPYPDQLRLRLRQRCPVTATTRSTAAIIISAGTTPSPRPTVAPGTTIEFECHRRLRRPAHARQHGRRVAEARLRQGQPGHRADLHRRGRAGRRAQGDDRDVQALRLRLDREHPGLRPARRPVSRSRRCTSGRTTPATLAPALFGPGGARAAEAVLPAPSALAPAEPGLHSVVPPRRVGGNLDIRDLSAGTVLYLPVEVAGGAVLGRRHPCRPGRRRGLRHGDREPDEGRAARSTWSRAPTSRRRASPRPARSRATSTPRAMR